MGPISEVIPPPLPPPRRIADRSLNLPDLLSALILQTVLLGALIFVTLNFHFFAFFSLLRDKPFLNSVAHDGPACAQLVVKVLCSRSRPSTGMCMLADLWCGVACTL